MHIKNYSTIIFLLKYALFKIYFDEPDSCLHEMYKDKLMWYMLGGKHKGISCILDTMDVQMWNQDDASPSSTFCRKHIAKATGVWIRSLLDESLLYITSHQFQIYNSNFCSSGKLTKVTWQTFTKLVKVT